MNGVEILASCDVNNLAELIAALQRISNGPLHQVPDYVVTVDDGAVTVTLERQFLTDKSEVYNIAIRELPRGQEATRLGTEIPEASFFFQSRDTLTKFIGEQFPERKCLKSPGHYQVKDGTISVFCEQLTLYGQALIDRISRAAFDVLPEVKR